ncbi:MAG: sugar fermentation stimulation protein [Lachnospiraceae bacterium]|nr:sugar fermentation stimulation protein [Lachnospiraceae bacterium]
MKMNDLYPNRSYKSSSLKERRKRKRIRRRKRLIMMVTSAAFLAGCAYFIALYVKQGKEEVQKEPYNMAQEEQTGAEDSQIDESRKEDESTESAEELIGPYGLWLARQNKQTVLQNGLGEAKVAMVQDNTDKSDVPIKGIYLSALKANASINEIIAELKGKEVNAVVIDIKDDEGRITYEMNYAKAKEIKAVRAYIEDMDSLLRKLKENQIYTIARIVSFKDPILAKEKTELALKKANGSIFYDASGMAWVNPYKKEVWEYLIEVAKQCVYAGFDEINFDYIRFCTESGMDEVSFGEEARTQTKVQVITSFVKYACETLKPLGVKVSADVYGAIIDSDADAERVGQSYKEMAKYLDYICPMIYPSHYASGYYGISNPDTQPYQLIAGALNASRKALLEMEESDCAKVRPWLQDFTATWVKNHITYGADEVRAQMDAVYDAGYEGWLLWNSRNHYTTDAWKDASANEESMQESVPAMASDIKKFIEEPWRKEN